MVKLFPLNLLYVDYVCLWHSWIYYIQCLESPKDCFIVEHFNLSSTKLINCVPELPDVMKHEKKVPTSLPSIIFVALFSRVSRLHCEYFKNLFLKLYISCLQIRLFPNNTQECDHCSAESFNDLKSIYH